MIKPILTKVGIENRGIHLQSWFSGIVVTLEPVRLFISVAVDFIVKLVAYYFALFFVYFVFEIVENREKHLSCEHAVWAGLMHVSFTYYAQILTNPLQTTIKPDLIVNETFNVKQFREVSVNPLVVIRFLRG